jgi:hypothetical protein
MLVTNLKAKRSSHSSKSRGSFTVLGDHNNGGKGPNARLCSWDGREEEEEDVAAFLCCQTYHCRLLARTDSDSTKSLLDIGFNQQ